MRLVLEFCDKGSLKDALDQSAFMQGEPAGRVLRLTRHQFTLNSLLA